MKFLSVCATLVQKLRRHKKLKEDVETIQKNIIDSFEQELAMVSRDLDNQIRNNNILQSRIDQLTSIRDGLERDLRAERNKPDKVVYENKFVMTEQMYQQLARSMEPPIVSANTTPHGTGYLLGIQRALTEFRNRYVAG